MLVVLCAAVALACVITPFIVMTPFRTQGKNELLLALNLYHAGPVITAIAAAGAVALVLTGWNTSHSHKTSGMALTVTLICAVLTRVNIFEIIFRPYFSPDFVKPETIALESNAMVMSFTQNGESHAYPVGVMGYHHIVNDIVGGIPVVATYCTVCHTGIVWKREIDGRTLTFSLAGIRDGNAILRDNQTETVWQQTSGEAIFGPLKGKHLELVHSDELSFGLWRQEQPGGYILKPRARFKSLYRNQGWEKFVEQFPAVIDTSKTGMDARTIVFGVATANASKAFHAEDVLTAGLVQDRVGTDPVLLIVGPDSLSVRAFHLPPQTTLLRTGTHNAIQDTETSSTWNFSGCATAGPRTGQCLPPLDVVKEYWFDWRNYHPDTEIFRS